MLTLRPTQRLARRLAVELPDALVPVDKPHADWCVHAFTAGRVRYLIATNTCALLSVVLRARGITDDRALITRTLAAIGDHLRGTGREFLFERLIAAEAGEVRFVPIGSRSVLGSINGLVFQAKWFLEKSDLAPSEVSARINRTPLSVLRHGDPEREFAAMEPRIRPEG
jgi:hypothetical protein